MKRVFTILVLAVVVCALGAPAWAQRDKQKQDTGVRSVEGAVTDPDGNPISGAVVYLTNTKTLQVRTYNAQEGGKYIFHGLSTNVDYQLKALYQGVNSDVKTLSVFDSRSKAVINLKIAKK